MTLHDFLQEFQCGLAIWRLGDEAFQNLAFVIERAPQIVPLAVDHHENFVQMSFPMARLHAFDSPLADISGEQRVEAVFAVPADIVTALKLTFGEATSITEQTDAWVRFDVAGVGLPALFERLINLDFPALPAGYASRTVIEHLGVYLIKHAATLVPPYGPRSSVMALRHALMGAAKSVL